MSTLIVGVDFGTTYSGVAWSFCAKGTEPEQVDVIKKWPSSESGNNERHKVPSKISYSRGPTGNEIISWGYNLPADAKVLTWFKLLLLTEDDMPEYVKTSPQLKNVRNMMNELGKDPVHVIADYLGQLWKHTLSIIKKEKGEELVEGARVLIKMTIPAIWQDYAREKMRQAMRRAGILEKRLAGETTLSFISEPEAAALATLPELSLRNDLEKGDSFIICDCGGGTVDIISYMVNENKPLKVSECVEGDGDLCGGVILDQAFGDRLMKHVGKHAWKKITAKEKKKMMLIEWEWGIKTNFIADTDKYVVEMPRSVIMPAVNFLKSVNVDSIKFRRGQDANMLVDSQLKAILEKTKKPAKVHSEDLIREVLLLQFARFLLTCLHYQFIILVGGFGRCPYIYQTLKNRRDPVKGSTEILQADGDRPWSAICRGAVISGATGQGLKEDDVYIQSRVARLSYGWTYTSNRFDPARHDERDRYFDVREDSFRARNQMEWGIKRGQDISAHEPATYNYIRKLVDLDTIGPRIFTDQMYTSASTNPSTRLDDTVRKFADFTIKTPVPGEELPIQEDSMGPYFYFATETRLSVSGASLSLSVFSQGRKVGGTDCRIAFNVDAEEARTAMVRMTHVECKKLAV
ncbi:putative Actin-like ATPase domain-containing protein [Seiridium unicorne]|uniref:Actin-like ATPase domain-containing protein n=1 Tax=Seiridium unicorne TaxID=138068 RepID=A0ABR2VHS0_9PEZI